MNRRNFLQSAAASGAALLGAGVSLFGQRTRRPPNIVFILSDDLGYNDLGCYGQKLIHTPNIDRLATEGMRFTNTYAGCSVCAPSRNVLMTGFHAGHVTIRANSGGQHILPGDVTVAQVLKSAGYATGCFGKWGLGDIGSSGVPWKHGFDQFFGYLHQIHAHFYYPPYLWDNDKKFPLAGNENGKRVTYSEDVIRERALEFIRSRASQQPFFCYVPFTIPHMEYLVPEDSLAEYRGKIPEQGPIAAGHYAGQEYPRAAYAAMITRMDRDVGRIMALLKELNLDNNTIVFLPATTGRYFRLNRSITSKAQDRCAGASGLCTKAASAFPRSRDGLAGSPPAL